MTSHHVFPVHHVHQRTSHYVFLAKEKSYYVFPVGALMQWLKLPAWKVGDRGLEPHSGLEILKDQNVSSLFPRKDSILWGASVTER